MIVKRYYVIDDADQAALMNGTSSFSGEWHGIDLGSLGTAGAGYHAIVTDPSPPPPTWQPLPNLLDPTTTIPAALAALLANAGVTSTQTMFVAANALGAILSTFTP